VDRPPILKAWLTTDQIFFPVLAATVTIPTEFLEAVRVDIVPFS
jgi:hypothetical protein